LFGKGEEVDYDGVGGYMKDKAVVTFDTEEVYELKRILLDNDGDGAMKYLRGLGRKIDDAMETKMKAHI
jgi:hypothetical protein